MAALVTWAPVWTGHMSVTGIGPPMLTIGADEYLGVKYATSSHHSSSLLRNQKHYTTCIFRYTGTTVNAALTL